MISLVGESVGSQIERKCSLAESGCTSDRSWEVIGGFGQTRRSLTSTPAVRSDPMEITLNGHVSHPIASVQKPGILIVAIDGSTSQSVILVALVACPDLRPHSARAPPPIQSDVLYLCVRSSDSNKYLTRKVSYF